MHCKNTGIVVIHYDEAMIVKAILKGNEVHTTKKLFKNKNSINPIGLQAVAAEEYGVQAPPAVIRQVVKPIRLIVKGMIVRTRWRKRQTIRHFF